MKSWMPSVLLSACLLLSGCEGCRALLGSEAPPVEPAPAPLSTYAVSVVAGEVRLERGGVKLLVDSGMIDGDVLVTGGDGAATVRLPDGRTLELGPNARLQLDATDGPLRVELGRGVLLARVPADAAEGASKLVLEVKTPLGLTRLGGGSEAELDADAKRVEVRLGSVVFLDAGGAELSATAGQEIVTDAQGVALVRDVGAEDEAQVLLLKPMEVVLEAGQRGVEVRRSGSTRWTAAPDTALTLAEGDAVRAVREGARFSIGALKLELDPGGELALAPGAPKEDGSPGLPTIDLVKGGATVQASGEGPGVIRLGDTVLSANEAGQARLVRGPQGLLVEVIAGTFSVGEGDTRQSLESGTLADLSAEGGVKVSTRERPPIVLKSARMQRVHHQGLPLLALGWDHEGPVVVEVSSDEDFSQLLLKGRVTSGYVEVQPPQRGALHWRVKDDAGTEVALGSARFSPERRQKSRQVRNEVPEGAQRTTVYFQSQLPALTFVYEPMEGAASYRFRLFREGNPQTPLIERTAKGARLELEAGTVKEGSYLWSVAPLDAAGKPLRGGRMSRLDLAYDNAVPELMVDVPRPGTRVEAGELVRAAGVAPVGGRVRANGEAMSVDAKGRFSGRVRVDGEVPCIIFELSRSGVPDTLTIRCLRSRP